MLAVTQKNGVSHHDKEPGILALLIGWLNPGEGTFGRFDR
jgi:hypothetical protein